MLTLAHEGSLTKALESCGTRPLGSALVYNLHEPALESVCAAIEASIESPWCPLVLAVGTVAIGAVAERLGRNVWGRAAVLVRQSIMSLDFREIEAVIAARTAPDRAAVVSYVTERAGPVLSAAVAQAVEGSPAWTSTLRRQLGRLRAPSPQHWFNLVRLVNLLHFDGSVSSRTLEGVALSIGMAPRTLSSWCARYLHCSWPEARRRLGWEWMVETMLRDPPPSPPRRSTSRPQTSRSSESKRPSFGLAGQSVVSPHCDPPPPRCILSRAGFPAIPGLPCPDLPPSGVGRSSSA